MEVMRKLYLFLLWVALGLSTYAQKNPADTAKNKDYYLGKRKSQLTAGWIIFGVGAATTLTGVIAKAAQVTSYIVTIGTSSTNSNAPEILMIAGTVCMVGSIPLFISAHDNKQKAIELSIGPKMEENDQMIQMFAGKYQPALSIRIKLNQHI
jgi:hypothetical protein